MNKRIYEVSRILIISHEWPITGAPATDHQAALADAVAASGRDAAIIANDRADAPEAADASGIPVTRIASEPPKKGGFLFALRNALFFDVPANPGNYAMLRDHLHTHLQEVLYDAVLIICPPRIYLRLGYWIHETFGIPVWFHLTAELLAGTNSWNHRRLHRKYLAAAKLITAGTDELLGDIRTHDEQQALVTGTVNRELEFRDLRTGATYRVDALLSRIIRKKQHS